MKRTQKENGMLSTMKIFPIVACLVAPTLSLLSFSIVQCGAFCSIAMCLPQLSISSAAVGVVENWRGKWEILLSLSERIERNSLDRV